MHFEAMNFNEVASTEHAGVLISQRFRCALGAIAEQRGDELDRRCLLHRSAWAQLSSAANGAL